MSNLVTAAEDRYRYRTRLLSELRAAQYILRIAQDNTIGAGRVDCAVKIAEWRFECLKLRLQWILPHHWHDGYIADPEWRAMCFVAKLAVMAAIIAWGAAAHSAGLYALGLSILLMATLQWACGKRWEMDA